MCANPSLGKLFADVLVMGHMGISVVVLAPVSKNEKAVVIFCVHSTATIEFQKMHKSAN